MNELLKINYEAEQPTVSARDLHEQLHIGTKFTTWFERMKEYGFSEGKEFFPKLGETSEQGGRPQTDFQISVDMAKQICITPPEKPEERMEEEKIDLPADNIEDKKEKIRKLVEEGYTNREIADRTGIPFGTVGYHAARFRKKEKEPAVDNSDRHLCKTCKFRSNRPTVNSCDYAGLMNHSRGCKVEECTKYEKGARMKMKDVEE